MTFKPRPRVRLVLLVLLATGLVAACGSDGDEGALAEEEHPSGTFDVVDVYTFEEIGDMVATSDAAIIGTVTDVAPGRTIGPPGEELQNVDVTVSVETQLWGSVAPEIVIETQDLAEFEAEWRDPDNQLVVFLATTDDVDADGRFHPTNSQSTYLVDGSEVTATVDDEFALTVAELSLQQLVSAVTTAKAQIASGKLKAQAPMGRPQTD